MFADFKKIRRKADTFYRREFELRTIERAMGEVDQNKLRDLLNEIADQLSLEKNNEEVSKNNNDN